MRSTFHVALGVLLCSCAESPRLQIEVHTDLIAPEDVDRLTTRVTYGAETVERAADIEGPSPYRFSIVVGDGAPSTIDLDVQLTLKGAVVVRASDVVSLPTTEDACVAVVLLEDGTSDFGPCGVAPKADAGVADAGAGSDGGNPDGGNIDGGNPDGGTNVEFPFVVKNIDPRSLDYGRAFSVAANRACEFDSTALTFTAGCGNAPPAVAMSQPQGDDVAVISASTIELDGPMTIVGGRAVVLVALEHAHLRSVLDVSATGTSPGSGASRDCPAGSPTVTTCEEGGGGGGGGGGGPGAIGGTGGNNACDAGAGGAAVIPPTMEPLVGGCAGGAGSRFDVLPSSGGGGGGALQIVSPEVIISGTIHTSGGGGDGATLDMDAVSGGGGGGGGGALLVQTSSLAVHATARVLALGGGGGGGGERRLAGFPGGDGRDGGRGAPNAGEGGDGGDGAGTRLFPGDGDNSDASGGGGGGGGGTIRFEATTCSIDMLAAVGPTPLGDCP